MCGCAYLNGGGPIFLGQFFSLMAGLLSVATIIDCSFATIDPILLIIAIVIYIVIVICLTVKSEANSATVHNAAASGASWKGWREHDGRQCNQETGSAAR